MAASVLEIKCYIIYKIILYKVHSLWLFTDGCKKYLQMSKLMASKYITFCMACDHIDLLQVFTGDSAIRRW